VRTFAAISALAVAALAAAPATAAAPKPRKVTLADNYFLPAKMKVAKGTKITWKWGPEAYDVHDVKLKSGPKGVKKFHSSPGTAGFSFKRTLKTPGVYKIVCTLHEEMTMTIRVRR